MRTPSFADADALFEVIEKNWSAIEAQNRTRLQSGTQARYHEKPAVQLTMSVHVDDVFRAVAKVAFNTLAARMQPEFVMAAAFDPIRDYITGRDVQPTPATSPEALSVDTRFVTSLESDAAPIVETEGHAVTIAYNHPSLFGWVTLYERHHFLVRIADVELSDFLPIVQEFSPVRGESVALDLPELVRRFRRVSAGNEE